VTLEVGAAELHGCTRGADGQPVASELVARFDCCLPEIDDPVVDRHEGASIPESRPTRSLPSADLALRANGVIGLDPVLAIAPGSDDGSATAVVHRPASLDRRRMAAQTIPGEHPPRPIIWIAQSTLQEDLGCFALPRCREKEIDGLAVAVDGAERDRALRRQVRSVAA
jgi:hypothetical protein